MVAAIVKTAKVEFSAEERAILEKAHKLTDELGDALRDACAEVDEYYEEIDDLKDLVENLDDVCIAISDLLDTMDELEEKYKG